MSVAFRAAALTGLLVVVVNPTLAQFKPSQSTYFTGGYVECGVVELRDSDKGKDPDPIYKIVVNLELDRTRTRPRSSLTTSRCTAKITTARSSIQLNRSCGVRLARWSGSGPASERPEAEPIL